MCGRGYWGHIAPSPDLAYKSFFFCVVIYSKFTKIRVFLFVVHSISIYITENNTELVTKYRSAIVLHAGTDPEGVGCTCTLCLKQFSYLFYIIIYPECASFWHRSSVFVCARGATCAPSLHKMWFSFSHSLH